MNMTKPEARMVVVGDEIFVSTSDMETFFAMTALQIKAKNNPNNDVIVAMCETAAEMFGKMKK